jgi:spermidine/putrescine-binding protein
MRRTSVIIISVLLLSLVASYILFAQGSTGDYNIVRVSQDGSAKLSGGSVQVSFVGRSFNKATNIKIIVTPVGSWSGIYVKDVTGTGFTAVSENGNPNAEFNWIALGDVKEPAMSIYRDDIPQSDDWDE